MVILKSKTIESVASFVCLHNFCPTYADDLQIIKIRLNMIFNEVINDSVSNNSRIEISYKSYNKKKSIRQLSNIEYSNEYQKHHRNSYDYISAYCHLRNDQRTFKLNRIEKVRFIGNSRISDWVTNPSFVSTNKSNSTSCYIATMAYGNHEHPKVVVLRTFRDDVLLTYFIGTLFVAFYYFISPKIVFVLKNQNTINKIIRKILDKLIEIIIKFR